MANRHGYESFAEYQQVKRAEYGAKFDPSDLAPQFIAYFISGDRIKVTSEYREVRTGTVGVTTGWRPAFLLMHRSTDHGSSDLLRASDKVTAVKRGSRYVPVI